MHKNRIRVLTSHQVRQKAYVLYWMQHTQRIQNNFALETAITYANDHGLPLKLLFVLTPDFKDAYARHYAFMLEGIEAVRKQCPALNIDFVLAVGAFETQVHAHLKNASLLVMDDAYMPALVQIKKTIATKADALGCAVLQVFSDVIVPVDKVSQKCEYAARTIRKKLHQLVDTYLAEAEIKPVNNGTFKAREALSIETLMQTIDADMRVKKSRYFEGGELNAYKQLDWYCENQLSNYGKSSDPGEDITSKLSPYLHFGQISAVDIYQKVSAYTDQFPEAVEAFIEQLLVRRELAYNFVTYCDGFDQFDTMTYPWAYKTMDGHLSDERTHIYSIDDYIHANTHDPYFNAAMIEMVHTGFMHNTMRMYWGKKIIEWSLDYKTAYETILTLNNRYFIDGRDPVSYASVAWLFGRHDRAFQSREVFGKLRYMNAKGLKRKYNMDAYLTRMAQVKSDSED